MFSLSSFKKFKNLVRTIFYFEYCMSEKTIVDIHKYQRLEFELAVNFIGVKCIKLIFLNITKLNIHGPLNFFFIYKN